MSDFEWYNFDAGINAWDQLAGLHFAYNQAGIAYIRAMRQFLADDIDRVAFLRQGLRDNTHVGMMSQRILRNLKAEEALQLLPEILFAYCHFTSDGDLQQPRDFVLSLPHEAVLNKIEEAAEPLLEIGTEYEYRRMLELYIQLDPGLTYRLAKRAAQHSDPEVKEVGEDFLHSEDQGNNELNASDATIAGSMATFSRIWDTPEEDTAWKYLEEL